MYKLLSLADALSTMKASFIEKTCEVKTSHATFPIKFRAPIWAKGYKCEPGTCGLCCIVQRPEKVPNRFFDVFPKLICGYYEPEKKKCRRYFQRRFGCRVISSRDGFTRVDRDTMREIISFSEPVVLNQFEMLPLRVIPMEYIRKNPIFRGRLYEPRKNSS